MDAKGDEEKSQFSENAHEPSIWKSLSADFQVLIANQNRLRPFVVRQQARSSSLHFGTDAGIIESSAG